MKKYLILYIFLISLMFFLNSCNFIKPTDPYDGVTLFPQDITHKNEVVKQEKENFLENKITLDKAIELALKNNPSLNVAKNDIEAAKQQTNMALGQRLPNAQIVGGYDKYLNNQRLIPKTSKDDPGVFSKDIMSSDFVVSIPLYAGGKIKNEILAAKLLESASKHKLARTKDELIFNIKSIFYNILSERKVKESLVFSKKALVEHLKKIKELIAAEKAANLDKLRTEVRIADLDQKIVQTQNILSIQKHLLSNLLGINTLVEPLGKLSFDKFDIPTIEDALQKAFMQRPDFKAEKSILEAQAKKVDLAKSGKLPSVNLVGSYGNRWAIITSDLVDGANISDDIGSIGIKFTIPVFQGRIVKSKIRFEKANLNSKKQQLRKLELQIKLEVETSILNITSASQRIETAKKVVEQSKENLRIEQLKYDLNKGSITDVLDAQTSMLLSQTNYYSSLADFKIAVAQYKIAVGEN